MELDFILNDSPTRVEAEPELLVLDLLRERMHLTGTKRSCGIGECGACTILVEGEPVNACLCLCGQIQGKRVYTVEGLSRDGELSGLQRAFLEKHAVQCGFCTPGMLMSAKALLLHNPHPSEEEIRRALSGNLCRCTGYAAIVEAVQAAAEEQA
jgi:carbon-monoxide dehydrogenase small subunit